MTFYHATYSDRIAAIQKEGLRPVHTRNFPDAEPGVYLSTDPWIALGILLEHTFDNMDIRGPREAVESYRIIVIDRTRVREELLAPDPQVDGFNGMFWLYTGDIDVTGMPVLTTEELGPPP